MFIWKAMGVPEKKIIAALFLFFVAFSSLIPSSAGACSCVWKGSFLTVSRDAPLVVIGKIIRHHPGKSPTMDVHVLETLKGGILDSGMVLQMGDGMHCRPTIDLFPTGTEWILAVNGQGSKPGSGLAISHCGEYWLKVENNYVIGSIDGDIKQLKKCRCRSLKTDSCIRNSVKNSQAGSKVESNIVVPLVHVLNLFSSQYLKDGKFVSRNSDGMKIWHG